MRPEAATKEGGEERTNRQDPKDAKGMANDESRGCRNARREKVVYSFTLSSKGDSLDDADDEYDWGHVPRV